MKNEFTARRSGIGSHTKPNRGEYDVWLTPMMDPKIGYHLSLGRCAIALSQGQFAIIDKSDYEKVNAFKWSAQWSDRAQTFYATRVQYAKNDPRKERKKQIYMHRFIVGTPEGMDTDHEDHNGLHNWKDNLRVATRSQNTFASREISARNTSGYRGVGQMRDPRFKHKKWVACIGHENKRTFLGCFSTAEEASVAYEAAAMRLFGKFVPRKGLTR